MSDNLDLGRVPEGTETPEVLINGAFGKIDGLFTEAFAVDLSAGNGAVTVAQIAAASVLSLDGAAVARSVTLPAAKRILFALNTGTADVTVTRGTASVVIPAGEGATLRLTGAENGLAVIGGAGGGGGDPGGGGGIEEAPADGKLYGRKDEAWAEIVATGGGGGGGEGGGAAYPVAPPQPGDYPTMFKSGSAGTGTFAANDRAASFIRDDTGASSADINFVRLRDISASALFTFDMLVLQQNVNRYGYVRSGIALREAATDKYLTFIHASEANNPVIARLNFTGIAGNNAGFASFVTLDSGTFIDVMLRVKRTATAYELYHSFDYGVTFDLLITYPLTNYFTAAADQIGFILNTYNTVGKKPRMTVPYANLTIN